MGLNVADGLLVECGNPSGSHAHSLSAPLQEVTIVPLLPMALVALDEMDKNNNPLYRCGPGPGPGGEGGCWGRSLQRLCFCQHSCQGEVLASRKDFRMNTCTPHPRGAFMLEPVGLSPMETLLPRTGEGSNVKPGGKEGSRGCAPYWVSCATISGPQNPPSPVYLPQAGLLELVPLPPPSAHS